MIPEDHVTVYDVTTQTYTSIPQSELASGMIRAEVEGHEGLVWIDADQLKPNNHHHLPFSGDRRDAVLRLVDAFPDIYQKTYEFWEDGFRRDANPDRRLLYGCTSQMFTEDIQQIELLVIAESYFPSLSHAATPIERGSGLYSSEA